MSIGAVIERMVRLGDELPADDARRHFHVPYLRTTKAVADALRRGHFIDTAWVEDWDVVFADLYLDALEAALAGDRPARPWAVAFDAAAEPGSRRLPPLRQVLLGMNAHINYDLPQALVAVIPSADFDDPERVALRERDHLRIDEVLASRVSAEDEALGGNRSLLDRVLTPANRIATKRFLVESRAKVWRNARRLDLARRTGPEAYATQLAELEELSARRVADLVEPGQVLLKLARRGFGVELSDGAPLR
ncbi:MAG: DUF5995 family protein [Frankiaceae bacterium]